MSGSKKINVQEIHGDTSPPSQILPFWNVAGESLNNNVDPDSFYLAISVTVGGLSTKQYKICGDSTSGVPTSTVELFNGASGSKMSDFNPSQGSEEAVTLNGKWIEASLNPKSGLLKTIKTGSMLQSVNMEFVQYSTPSRGDRSGAYLFQPDGPAKPYISNGENIPFRIIRGPIVNEVHVMHDRVKQVLSVNSFGTSGGAISLENYFDIRGLKNFELVMRMNTDVKSEKTMFSDLNGLTHSKRVYYDKLHLQGNVYPITSSAFLQDQEQRFTVLTSQSSGVSSLSSGQIDVRNILRERIWVTSKFRFGKIVH